MTKERREWWMGKYWPDGGYSADVEIYLTIIATHEKISVAGVCGSDIQLRAPRFFVHERAVLTIVVDGEERSSFVILNSSDGMMHAVATTEKPPAV